MLAEREKLFSAIAVANSQLPFQLSYNQYFYYNKNLPNLENHNGLYFPKGVGSISSLLMHYKSKHLIISVEPYILDSLNTLSKRNATTGALTSTAWEIVSGDVSGGANSIATIECDGTLPHMEVVRLAGVGGVLIRGRVVVEGDSLTVTLS